MPAKKTPADAEADREAVLTSAKAQIASSDALLKSGSASIASTKRLIVDGRRLLARPIPTKAETPAKKTQPTDEERAKRAEETASGIETASP